VEDVRDLCTSMAIIANGSVLTQGKPADYIDELSGCIWNRTISKEELGWFKENTQLISSRLNGGKINIHVFSKTQPEGFAPAEPGLEDVYFNTLFKN
jgi:ABC-type multidrug transport system ATPase subunit